MSFDPTKPVEGSEIDAAELRSQFNALQEQITALQNQLGFFIPVLQANNATMSLDWMYTGKDPEEFRIFAHQPHQAPGVFDVVAGMAGSVRTWATDFDSPADAVGYKYYIQAVDANDAPLAPPSNMVNFAAG
jgi:hypothetical protein